MTFVFSIIAVTTLLITLAKFITKRLDFKRADKLLVGIHCKLAYILIIAAVIHMISSFSVFDSRPISIYIFGALLLICMIGAVISYHNRKALGKKWIVIHRLAAVLICVILVCHVGVYFYSIHSYQKKVSNLVITGIDLSKILNGTYIGEYDVQYIYAKVEVVVKDGAMTNIDILEHRNEKGAPAEAITEDIIKKQKVNVDAVSGATNSSKVIEKAIENALNSAGK